VDEDRIALSTAAGSSTAPDAAGSILDIVMAAHDRGPDNPALVFEDGLVVTVADLVTRAQRFAAFLQQTVSPGDRVAIVLGNRTEWVIAWLATVASRAMLVSINPAAREHDAGHMLRDSAARIVIVDDASASLVDALRAGCPELANVLRLRGPEPDGLSVYGADLDPVDLRALAPRADDVVNVYYTSGTTGLPKGCMLENRFWLRFVGLYKSIYGLEPDDRLLCWFQFFYVDPPWMILASLSVGAALVVMRRLTISRFWDVVEEREVTQLFGSASLPALLLKRPSREGEGRTVRFSVHVGIPRHLHEEVVARWGFDWVEAYGLTETGLVVAMPLEFAQEMIGSGSIGRPCDGVKTLIVDDGGEPVPLGSPGELLLRAPGLMRGYLNNPDATAHSFRGGWFHTGDLVTADERGFLYFVARIKDIIRRSGENVAAAEVEEILRQHPAVLDAAVVAVPDEIRGEEVKAFVALVQDADPADASPRALVTHCETRLARFKVPRYIEFINGEFPRTPSMRIKKSELVAQPSDGVARHWDSEQERGR
jgi:crotonobetaine/carnitine-CoA ligase